MVMDVFNSRRPKITKPENRNPNRKNECSVLDTTQQLLKTIDDGEYVAGLQLEAEGMHGAIASIARDAPKRFER